MVRLSIGCVLAFIKWKMMERSQLKPVKRLKFNKTNYQYILFKKLFYEKNYIFCFRITF